MAIKIAINGFGRIGRLFFRALKGADDIEVVAINDLADAETLAVLLKYDSVHGRYDGDVSADGENIVVDGKAIPCLTVRNPADLPWGDLGVEIVIESTGVFRTREGMQGHIDAGAKKVLLSAPPKGDIDATIVFGVNDDTLKAGDTLVSNASCTTNCLAPVAKVLSDNFGIESGLMTTIHSYTNDQNILDLVHKDYRRMRAAALNMIPTTTGAASAVALVLPELQGKLNGMAMRVPTPTVSIVDLTVNTAKDVSVEAINAAFKSASESDAMKGILGYSEEPLVSMDYKGDPRSSIFDALSTMVIGDKMAKVLSWYDNEWGYSSRCADLAYLMGYKDGKPAL
jgi:glyceraldehyde 3-phosphate dehydrogenase